FRGGSTATNVVCLDARPYTFLLGDSARMVVTNSSFKSDFRVRSCMVAQLSGSVSLVATDAILHGYECPEACVNVSGAGTKTTLTRTNVTNNVLTEGELGVVYQNAGSLQLTNVLATGNVANYAFFVDNLGTAVIDQSTFIANHGAALRFRGWPTASISNSTFMWNMGGADAVGGAIVNQGYLTVTGSSFAGNSAKFGGAIMQWGYLALTESVLSNNSASVDGGAIYITGLTYVDKCTFAGNTAKRGGAWFAINRDWEYMSMADDIVYLRNSPTQFAGNLHSLTLLSAPPTDMPLTSVLSGSTINMTLHLLAHDLFGQQYVIGGNDPVPIFHAGSETLTLLGERTKTIFTGSTN
ncbi:hypothetical protein GGF32_009390, partial [Allomyces javanicus]